jgi:methylenetetrahydrofolate reductase (NADPH)
MASDTPDTAALRRGCTRLAASASLELLPGATAQIPELARLLPAGARIFVPHLPGRPIGDAVPTLVALRQAGFEPVAHVAARRLASRSEYGSFLEAARTAGLREMLALGGDLDPPAGPFREAADLLEGDMIRDAGIGVVHFGAYPDPHPRIPAEILARAMQRKLDLAARQGIATGIVTQFSFAAENVATLARGVQAGSQIRLGIAGPCGIATLLRFARLCGVANSLRAAAHLGVGALQLTGGADPTASLMALVAALGASEADGSRHALHVYAFGGAPKAAAWLASIAANREAH